MFGECCPEENRDPHDECRFEIDRLNARVKELEQKNCELQSIASNGWIEAWHSGNGFMALPPGDDHSSVMRCWGESSTLQALQRINSTTAMPPAITAPKPTCPHCRVVHEMPNWIAEYHRFNCECGWRFEAKRSKQIVSSPMEHRE